MGDLYLDFRAPGLRATGRAARFLQFYPDIRTFVFQESAFSLLATLSDSEALWAPYRSPDGSTLVALAGRIALEDDEWDAAKAVPGVGGLACKAIYSMFARRGTDAFGMLNGSFAIAVVDGPRHTIHIASDRCGMTPLFALNTGAEPVFATHQDVLALVSTLQDFDRTSICEFLATGRLTYPFTYHTRVRAMRYGATHSVSWACGSPESLEPRPFFTPSYRPDPSEDEEHFASRLAAAFRKAVDRRTHPILGKTALGLSGGLDSRMILCAARAPERVHVFTFFDVENREYRTARKVASAAGASFKGFRRSPEHYGNAAELGARISGGTGSFLSNHLLGFRGDLLAEGYENILNGQFCDYFFKGLAQNNVVDWFWCEARPVEFALGWYAADHLRFATPLMEAVTERLDALFPAALRADGSDDARLEIEGKRLFPLSYEPENPEVLIPQRTIGWYMPTLDNDLLEVYFTMPVRLKFSRTMYESAATRVCPPGVSAIPNSNTGAPVGVSRLSYALHRLPRHLRDKLVNARRKLAPSIYTDGSWLNGGAYVRSSSIIKRLWEKRNDSARGLISDCIGFDALARGPADWRGADIVLLKRLLTVKIWLDELCA